MAKDKVFSLGRGGGRRPARFPQVPAAAAGGSGRGRRVPGRREAAGLPGGQF